MERKDKTCLGAGEVYAIDNLDINGNELIVGSSGSGKTTSISEPRILHTFNRSLVVPITKRELFYKYAPVLKKRGYKVWDLNLENPGASPVGYDPCDFIKTETDVLNLAGNICGNSESRSLLGEMDSYWSEATISVLAAEIGLAVENAKSDGKNPTFGDVLKLHKLLEIDSSKTQCVSNLDEFFDVLELEYANSQAPKLWRTLRGNSSKTAACIYSMVNNALDKLCTKEIEVLFSKKEKINFRQMAKEKTALFITTSPVTNSVKKLSDMLYGDLFKELYTEAKENGGVLSVPIHIVCDDFACGSRIPKFDSYIASFRSMGISVTILLQSISQLHSVYGKYEAQTIQNNCDTLVFLGSMDIDTCREFSIRTDKPLEEILSMQIGKVVVARRGRKAVTTERYQTYKDEEYLKIS